MTVTDQPLPADPGALWLLPTHDRPLDWRLDAVAQQLAAAEMAAAELVHRLEPVLPAGYGTAPAPRPPVRQAVDSSPLAARLDELAVRGQAVVDILRGALQVVDL